METELTFNGSVTVFVNKATAMRQPARDKGLGLTVHPHNADSACVAIGKGVGLAAVGNYAGYDDFVDRVAKRWLEQDWQTQMEREQSEPVKLKVESKPGDKCRVRVSIPESTSNPAKQFWETWRDELARDGWFDPQPETSAALDAPTSSTSGKGDGQGEPGQWKHSPPGNPSDKFYDSAYEMIRNGTEQGKARAWFFEQAGITKIDKGAKDAFNQAMRRRRKGLRNKA